VPGPARTAGGLSDHGISIIADGPATLSIISPGGGTIEYDADADAYVSSIPGAVALRGLRTTNPDDTSMASPIHDAFYLPEPGEGQYRVTATAVGSGRIGLTGEHFDLGGNPSNAITGADIEPDELARFVLSYSAGVPITFVLAEVTGAADAPAPLEGGLTHVPNPSTAEVRFGWTATSKALATLEIVDVGGRHVRTLDRRLVEAGSYVSVWDGRDEAGRRVAPGLYFARLECGKLRQTARIVRIGGN